MIPPRIYTVSFAATASASALDFFELITGSTAAIGIVGIDIAQTTELGDAMEEQVDVYIKRATGSYTSGSGGNTGVARPPVRVGDAAATFTAETVNTTRIAVGSGTLTTVYNSAINVRAGWKEWFLPETIITCGISSALAIGMTGAPVDTITWVGTVYVAEFLP